MAASTNADRKRGRESARENDDGGNPQMKAFAYVGGRRDREKKMLCLMRRCEHFHLTVLQKNPFLVFRSNHPQPCDGIQTVALLIVIATAVISVLIGNLNSDNLPKRVFFVIYLAQRSYW